MPRGRDGRGGGRNRGGHRNCEEDNINLIEDEGNLPEVVVAAIEDRVVYARVEQVAKKSEFVLDFPDLDEYLSVPFAANDPCAEYCYEPIREVTFSHFNADGITGKISLKQDVATYRVEYGARLANMRISFGIFRFSVKAFLLKDQRQILVASVDSARSQGPVPMVIGEPLLIPCADILEKAKLLGNGTKFRIVLNVEIKFFLEYPIPNSTVGSCGVHRQGDPPFLKQLQERDDCDVQLVCGDEAFPVHGFILKNVSNIFRRMLELPMQEAATRKIVIKDLSADTVKKIVEYIYHGRINAGSDAQVVDLLYAAEKYEFDLLKTACLEGMVTSMSNENVAAFLETSVRVNAGNEVIKTMVAYCMNRITELRKREDFRAFAQANPELFL